MNRLRLMLLVLPAFLLTGCPGGLPTFKHCQEVRYNRVGPEIAVEAKCSAGYELSPL